MLKPSLNAQPSLNAHLNAQALRENKKSSAKLDFHYNPQFNYNILNCCWNLCCDNILEAGTKNCCVYRMHEIFEWLLCMKTLALDILHIRQTDRAHRQTDRHTDKRYGSI